MDNNFADAFADDNDEIGGAGLGEGDQIDGLALADGEADPAAEFLAREQEELAGLEDDAEEIRPPPVVTNGFSSGKEA